MGESTVTWKTEHLTQGVLRIAFGGKGGIGSEGAADGTRMRVGIDEALSVHEPEALLVDLRSFDYEFGNWIWGPLVGALRALGGGRVRHTVPGTIVRQSVYDVIRRL